MLHANVLVNGGPARWQAMGWRSWPLPFPDGMASPRSLSASSCQLASCGVGCQRSTKGESKMNATAALPVVGIDIANSVFQLAVADGAWRVTEGPRLTRTDRKSV